MTPSPDEPSYRTILEQAWPAILASAAVPLLGLGDTAIVSMVGGDEDLGAVALSTLVFNCIYWGVGFLRMSTTALVAQSFGASRHEELSRVVVRALLLGSALGLLLIGTRNPLASAFLTALGPDEAVAMKANAYIRVRLLAAPAVLVTMAVTGALIGLGRTRALLGLQLFTNAVNLIANVGFVWGIGGSFRGVVGIAAGTLCAEWSAAAVALWILLRAPQAPILASLRDTRAWIGQGWRGVLGVNFHIFVRTLALLLGFAWFTRVGTQLGPQTLAGNHLLQQFISVAAFFLDGVAFVAESQVGQTIGAKDFARFRLAVRRTSVAALGFGVTLAVTVLLVGPAALTVLAPSDEVFDIAYAHLPLAALYVVVGVLPWQLDGIFIGAACGAALRNAAVISSAVFVSTALWWSASGGNSGLWWAMIVYIAMRGVTLLLHWRHVTRLFS